MSARDMREACVKHVADAIAACYRRAWTSPDEMRGATGALKRLAVSMANLPLPLAPAASVPADDAVREMVAEETARCAAVVQGLAMDAERDGNEAVGRALRLAASKVRRTGTAHETERLVREATRAAAERAGRDAKGGA